MDRRQLAHAPGSRCAGICCRLDRAHIAAYHDGDKSTAYIFRANQNHIGSLDHRVGGFNRADQAFGLDHSKSDHSRIYSHVPFLSLSNNYDFRKTTLPSTSSESIIDMMTESTGESFVRFVCRAEEPAAVSTRSPM